MPEALIADRYEILHRLGQGGMGTVYQAKDHRLMREVAIKVLMEAAGEDDTGRFYFQREARAAAALQHHGIVQIFDYSGPDERPAFIVMELLRGQNLHRIIQERQPIGEDAALAIVLEIAAALAHAHSHDVIHRDIKPGNVLVSHEGRVAITDFGLAKAYQDPEKLGRTVAGRQTEVFGTPGFLSPEQVLREESGPESDVFALGCVAYALSAGDSPFAHPDPVEALRRIADVEYRPLREARPDLSAEWERLVHSCLMGDVLDRAEAKEVEERARKIMLGRGLADTRQCVGALMTAAHAKVPHAFASGPSTEPENQPEHTVVEKGSDTDPDPLAKVPEHTVTGFVESTSTDIVAGPDLEKTQATLVEPRRNERWVTAKGEDSWNIEPSTEPMPTTGIVLRGPTLEVSPGKTALDDETLAETPSSPPGRRPLWAVLLLAVAAASVVAAVALQNQRDNPAAVEVVAVPPASSGTTSRGPAVGASRSPATPTVSAPAVAPTVSPAGASGASAKDLPEPATPDPAVHEADGGEDEGTVEDRSDPSRPGPGQKKRKPKAERPQVTVQIAVNPWGAVFLDGKKVGNAPMVRHLTSTPGAHKVRVVHPSKGRIDKVVQFGQDELVLFDFDDP